MHIISLWIGKTTLLLLQLLGRRGAALPGRVVELLDPHLLNYMLSKISGGVVIVSGTNGKTTSTKMLTAVYRASGKKVLTNPTGSNFTRGVIASIVQYSSWGGRLDFDIAVLELDEAYAAKFVRLHKPRYSLILNVMRDQMDRFGEIDHTARLLKEVVKNTTETIVLNRDDPRVVALAKDAECKVEYFGVADKLRDIFRSDDELHGKIYNNNIEAACVLEKVGDEKITTTILDKQQELELSLYGIYNAQNVCAVIATAIATGQKIEQTIDAIQQVKPAFGRGERIDIDGKKIILQLVKNPGGFRHALIGAKSIKDDITMIAINDDYADGRDVSWLWDVDFNTLVNKKIITTGIRAYDIALRLDYDDVKTDDIEQNLELALNDSLSKTTKGGIVHIYTTYTAMLKLRQLISKMVAVDKV